MRSLLVKQTLPRPQVQALDPPELTIAANMVTYEDGKLLLQLLDGCCKDGSQSNTHKGGMETHTMAHCLGHGSSTGAIQSESLNVTHRADVALMFHTRQVRFVILFPRPFHQKRPCICAISICFFYLALRCSM